MSHPQLSILLAQARTGELRQVAARPGWRSPGKVSKPTVSAPEQVTLRFGFPDDSRALARLAELDSARIPAGPVLLAEVGAELRAALSLSSGEVIANPFHRSTWLVDLLHARARQLHGAAQPGRGRRRRTGRLRSLLAWR